MYEITGILLKLSDIEQLITKSGATFEKRYIILDCSRVNEWSGEVYKNVLCLEISQAKVHEYDNMAQLIGQTIKVRFAINGREATNSMGEKRYFTTLRLIGIETSPKNQSHNIEQQKEQFNVQRFNQEMQSNSAKPDGLPF